MLKIMKIKILRKQFVVDDDDQNYHFVKSVISSSKPCLVEVVEDTFVEFPQGN